MSIPTEFKVLVTACALGLFMVAGLVWEWRDAERAPPARQQAKPVAVQPRIPEGATNGSSASPSSTPAQIAAPAPGSAKPVIIGVVTPWIEIARRPQYVQASPAERKAMRDLYWHLCVEEKIPLAQRTSAYWQFVRDWDAAESGVSEDPSRTPSMSQFLREQQAAVPSPVNTETMRRWCKR